MDLDWNTKYWSASHTIFALDKCRRVIRSCQTLDQLKSAHRYYRQMLSRIPSRSFWAAEVLLGQEISDLAQTISVFPKVTSP